MASIHTLSTSMHHVYRFDRSGSTYHLTDFKNHGDQDNRCWFWHCYTGTTLGLNVSQNQWRMATIECGIKPGELKWKEIRSWKFQGDKQGWRYNRGQYSRWPLYIVYLKVHICIFLTLLRNTTHLMSLIYLYCSIEDSLNVNYILLKSFDCLHMHLNLFWIWYPLATIHAIFRIFFWNWI